jgi:hypothetical protein
VAAALRAIGATASQVAAALRSVYAITFGEAGPVLKNVGYGASQIAAALKDVFQLSASQVAVFLDSLGFSQGTIENALASAGYGASAIREAIEGFFGNVGDVFCGFFGCET